MSDSLDKFVLQYTVELKDSIRRLEELNSAVDKTSKGTEKSKNGFKVFAEGASDELGKVLPGLDKVTAAARLMGGQFAIAATAVAALGAGIKIAMNTRDLYNRQRQEGMDLGMSAVRVEDYRRKFERHSGGMVSGSTAISQLQKLRDAESEAYADPQRMGQNARMFKMLGIDIGAFGKGSTPMTELLSKFGERMQAMTPAGRQGWAKANGFDQNFVEYASQFGSSLGSITDTTTEDLKGRAEGEDATKKLNDSLAQTREEFHELEQVISNHLLPGLSKLVDMFNGLVKHIPGTASDTMDALDPKKSAIAGKGLILGSLSNMADNFGDPKSKTTWHAGLIDQLISMFKPAGFDEKEAAYQQKKLAEEHPEEAAKKAAADAAERRKREEDERKKKEADLKAANDQINAQDQQNQAAAAITDQQKLLMNMFAGAVATFANAVDEHQAWAAWAGEVGHAAGLGSKDNDQTGTQNDGTVGPTAPTKFDDIFARASKKWNVPEDLLKRIVGVESHFNPNATSEKGAVGLMQIVPSNYKELGITDPKNPEQNIMGGAQLMSEYLKKATSTREALMFYHGGYDRSGWGPLTYSYPDKVLGDAVLAQNYGKGTPSTTGISQNTPKIVGQSRASLQVKAVQENVAARLGVPWQQVAMGGVNRGDVDFAISQMKAGVQNQIQSLGVQAQQAQLPPLQRAKILNEQRDQEAGLAQLNKWGDTVSDKAQPGPRSITIGERAIIVNVNGTQDPQKVAEEIANHLQSSIGDIANAAATGVAR